jgi:hypothetical protein
MMQERLCEYQDVEHVAHVVGVEFRWSHNK